MKTQVNLKIDSHTEEMAMKQAKKLGLSLSSIVNATLTQFVRTGELEFSTAPKMTSFLEDLVNEARADYKANKTSGPFSSVDDLMTHLKS